MGKCSVDVDILRFARLSLDAIEDEFDGVHIAARCGFSEALTDLPDAFSVIGRKRDFQRSCEFGVTGCFACGICCYAGLEHELTPVTLSPCVAFDFPRPLFGGVAEFGTGFGFDFIGFGLGDIPGTF